MQAAGFYPEGGGEISATVEPGHAMPPLDLRHRGTLEDAEVVAMVAGMPFEVAERLAANALRKLRDTGVLAQGTRLPVPARRSSGSHLLVVASFERSRAGFGAVGDPALAPERASEEAVSAFATFLRRGGAVDRHLGDQLLVPAALVAAGLLPPPPGVVPSTRYSVSAVTKHLLTNGEVVKRFLPVEVMVSGREEEEGEVRVQPSGAGGEVVALPQER